MHQLPRCGATHGGGYATAPGGLRRQAACAACAAPHMLPGGHRCPAGVTLPSLPTCWEDAIHKNAATWLSHHCLSCAGEIRQPTLKGYRNNTAIPGISCSTVYHHTSVYCAWAVCGVGTALVATLYHTPRTHASPVSHRHAGVVPPCLTPQITMPSTSGAGVRTTHGLHHLLGRPLPAAR